MVGASTAQRTVRHSRASPTCGRTYVRLLRYRSAPMSKVAQQLEAFIREELNEDEAEHLVGWIAWRVGRPAALAGPQRAARVARAVEWCSPAQQLALLTWLRRRAAGGGDYSPGS